MRQLQIEPSIAVAFDNNVGMPGKRTAVVTNESGCDITDLTLSVSIPAEVKTTDETIEGSVMKHVATHELNRRSWRTLWQRRWTPGASAQVDCEAWFIHAREILTLSALTTEEKTLRGTVILDVSCRRVADKRKFRAFYVYRVMLLDNQHFMALPIEGENPADAGKRLILRRKGTSE